MAGSPMLTRLQSTLVDVILTILSIVAFVAEALIAVEEIFAVSVLA